MSEKPRIPTRSQIIRAERERASGGYDYARDQVDGIIGFPLGNFSRRNLSQQQRFLAASRIYTSATISWAREQWNAPAVAEELTRARRAIVDIYDHPEVQTTARRVNTGINNESYEYHTEMRRDKILYTLTLAGLTGNNAFLTAAINEMDATIAEAEEPTVKTLLQFDQQRLRHRQTPTEKSFTNLTTAFESATHASLEASNWERAATISARYILDVEKLGDTGEQAVRRGREVYDNAVENDQNIANILNRERVKERVERNRYAAWQASTPDGVNYSELQLPR